MENVEQKKPERHVDVVPIIQPPIQYLIWAEDQNNLAGYCLITAEIKQPRLFGSRPSKEANIWHIYTDPKYRRRGYAADLLLALKQHYDVIRTEGLTDESRYMLKKNGFVKDGKHFIWRRIKAVDGSK